MTLSSTEQLTASSDLSLRREQLADAAGRGDLHAMREYSACLAAGYGGSRDWQAALELLADWVERDTIAARQLELIKAMSIDVDGNPTAVPPLREAREGTRIALAFGAMTAEECEFLARLAEPAFGRATVINASGKLVEDPIRNNQSSTFTPAREWPFVHAINRRIAAISKTQAEQGEALNVLKYSPGQEYKVHCDAGPRDPNPRILTALIYLNRGYEGGETHFPAFDLAARGGVGDLLIFGNVLADGRQDVRMQHAGLPVTSGVKLIASRWIRQRPLKINEPDA